MQTKTIFLSLLFILMGLHTGFAQVGIGTTDPDETAALDIVSTDKGVLVPRMLESERLLIGSAGSGPAEGLLVYQTDEVEGFYYYDGTVWSLLGVANEKWAFNDNGLYATQPDNIGIRTENPTSALQVGDLFNSTDEYLTMAGAGGNVSKTGIRMQHFSSSYGFTIESNDLLPAQGLNFLRHANNPVGESAMFIGVGSGNVGMGTTAPKTSLQVLGNPENTNTADGVQVPVLTLAQLEAKVTAYGPDQNGAIVYVDDVSAGSGNTTTANISTAGYYYYDAANLSWQAMSGGTPGATRSLQSDLALTSALCNCTSFPPAMIQSLLDNGYTHQELVDFGISLQNQLDGGQTPMDLYNGGVALNSIYGKTYQGGLIFYLDANTGDGLVSAATNQSSASSWGCFGTDIPGAPNVLNNPPSGPGADIGWGADNTTAIVNNCGDDGIAARLCDDLILNGYDDWFLPSVAELNLMYTNLHLAGLGGFDSTFYWSSTENPNYSAWLQSFNLGNQYDLSKDITERVRAVRAF